MDQHVERAIDSETAKYQSGSHDEKRCTGEPLVRK